MAAVGAPCAYPEDETSLEHLLFLAQRDHGLKEARSEYELARLDMSVADDQEDLLLANLRLENAVDDLKLLNSRLEILTLQFNEEKWKVKVLEAEALKREAYVINRDASVTEKNAALEKMVKELQTKVEVISSNHSEELKKVMAENEEWKSQLSDQLVLLVGERNFVWCQLRKIEKHYCSQVKIKEEQLRQALAESQQLRVSLESAQKAADEKGVELTITRMELQKLEDECYDMKQTIARLEANPDTSSSSQLGAREQSAKMDELQRTRHRVEELTRENVSLRTMHAEMEAKLQMPQQQLPPMQGGMRKTVVTRNLTAQLEDAAITTTTGSNSNHTVNKGESAGPRRLVRSAPCKEKSRKRQAKRKQQGETTGGRLRRPRK